MEESRLNKKKKQTKIPTLYSTPVKPIRDCYDQNSMPFIHVFQKIFDHLFQNVHFKKSIQNCSLFLKPDRNSGKRTLGKKKKNFTKSKKTPLPPTL